MRYSRIPLSAATDWLGLKITPIVSPGLEVHAQTGETDAMDEIYLWAENTHTGLITVTVEFGGTTAPDHIMERVIPAHDGYQIVKGRIMKGNASIKVFASVTDKINIWGYVNRIHP